jgi:hypothetical protein
MGIKMEISEGIDEGSADRRSPAGSSGMRGDWPCHGSRESANKNMDLFDKFRWLDRDIRQVQASL